MSRPGNRRVTVNGRFTVHRITGVQRYAWEITRRLGDRVTLAVPRGRSSGVFGHLWEQVRLPYLSQGSLLWSPCGTGPLGMDCQVVTVHDLAPLIHPEWFTPVYASWYRWLVPQLCKRVRRVIAVSEFTKQQIIEICDIPENRVVVVPNGVTPLNKYTDTTQKPSDLQSKSRRYFLYVGSLEPRKNLKTLLEAWNMSRVHRDFQLLIVGAAGSRNVFRRLELPTNLVNVVFLGYVNDEALDELYRNACALLYPSLYEGFGLPVLEAMSRGTPVMTSRATACAEVAGQAALLVEPTSEESIATGLDRLGYDDVLRAELAARGIARSKKFCWDLSAERTWKVLQEAAGEC